MEHTLLKNLNGNRNTCCNGGWIYFASLRKSNAIQWINPDTRNAFLAPVWLCFRLQTVTDLYMAHMHIICFWLCFFPFTNSSANRNDILINASHRRNYPYGCQRIDNAPFFSVILSPFAHSPCTLSTSPQWKLLNYTPSLVWICGATNNHFIRNQLQCSYTNSLESIYQLITMVATWSQHIVLYRETIWLRLPVARQHPGIIPTHPKVGSQHQWC